MSLWTQAVFTVREMVSRYQGERERERRTGEEMDVLKYKINGKGPSLKRKIAPVILNLRRLETVDKNVVILVQ